MARSKTKPGNFAQFKEKLAELFSDAPQSIPLFLSLLLLTVFILVTRMKNIDQDYSFNKLNLKLVDQLNSNKSLKAEKADLVSSSNLKKYAEKYNLKEPTEKQIIIISK